MIIDPEWQIPKLSIRNENCRGLVTNGDTSVILISRIFLPPEEKMASSENLCDKGKRIVQELQKKASEQSTILGSEVPEKSGSNPPQQASSCSSSHSCMTSFRRPFNTSCYNPFHEKRKGNRKSAVKGSFMRDVILLTGPDFNSVPRQKSLYTG